MEPKIVNGRLTVIALLSMLLTLAACGDKPQQATPAKLFKQERESLDKAKGVEQNVTKSAEDLKREEEKQAK